MYLRMYVCMCIERPLLGNGLLIGTYSHLLSLTLYFSLSLSTVTVFILYLYPSIHPSVSPSIPIYLSAYLSVCLYWSILVQIVICPSVSWSSYLSMSVCLSWILTWISLAHRSDRPVQQHHPLSGIPGPGLHNRPNQTGRFMTAEPLVQIHIFSHQIPSPSPCSALLQASPLHSSSPASSFSSCVSFPAWPLISGPLLGGSSREDPHPQPPPACAYPSTHVLFSGPTKSEKGAA